MPNQPVPRKHGVPEPQFLPCPDCDESGHVWTYPDGVPTVAVCPMCKGTHRFPVETERDKMTKAFYTGDNT